MSITFLHKRKISGNCPHKSLLQMEIAGLSREVCESCGKVSLTYLGTHLKPERVHAVAAARSAASESSSED